MEEEKNPFSVCNFDRKHQAEYWAALALRNCKGIGARSACKLASFFGSAKLALENKSRWKEAGISEKVTAEFTAGKWQTDAKREWDEAHRRDLRLVLWIDREFPALLKELPDAPLLLYFAGCQDLLNSPCVALVGSRNALPANRDIARQLAADLAGRGITVVSGMAMGIDTAAHEGALPKPGSSIGVLGTGINIIYPWCNKMLFANMRASGLLVSEFPPSSPPVANHFPIRNRIISGLSLGTVVVEAAEKSGSLITAKLALEQNREVFAIPGPAFNSRSTGCQNLVRSGAHPVFSADDIFSELESRLLFYQSPYQKQDCHSAATPDEIRDAYSGAQYSEPDFQGKKTAQNMLSGNDTDKIMEILKVIPACHIDELADKLGKGPEDLSPLLLSMELLGKVKRLPGGFYENAR